MKPDNVNRRDFHKFTVAAMGGMMAGSLVGCGGKTEEKTDKTAKTEDGKTAAADKLPKEDPAYPAWTGAHVCRGLNACKGQGKGMDNECAGQGACFTSAEQSCGGKNACKNLGGCGDTVASNECKGKGSCQVPLMKTAYETAYKKFKADMEKAGKADKLPKEPPGTPAKEE